MEDTKIDIDKIEKIRAEIERIKSRAMSEEGKDVCDYILSILDATNTCLDDGGAPNSQKCGDCTIACEARVEEDRDVVFWKGMRYAYEQMKSEAVEGEVTERKFGSSIPETFAVTTEHFESSTLKKGDKVKVFIFEKE